MDLVHPKWSKQNNNNNCSLSIENEEKYVLQFQIMSVCMPHDCVLVCV